MSNRVAIWAAVSSLVQAEDDKVSLPDQEAAGRQFAASISGQVVRVYTVPGHSREYLDYPEAAAEMEAYRQLDDDCRAHAFDVLWCRSRDRLGRTLSLVAAVEGRVQRAGAEVYSAAMPHALGQSTSDGSTLMAALEGWQAQKEVSELRRRHHYGMRGRVRRGLPGGRIAYGYRAVRDSLTGALVGLEFEPAEVGGVRLATDLYLRGYPLRIIAQELGAAGYRGGDGALVWESTAVQRLVMRDIYAGIVTWGQYRSEPSPAIPAYWDAETFAAVQRERERRRDAHNKRQSSALYGVAFCAQCNRAMIRSPHKGIAYLRCRTWKEHTCPHNYVSESRIMDAIAAALEPLTNEDALAAYTTHQEDTTGAEERLAEIEARFADLAKQRFRLADALAHGLMEPDVYHVADLRLREQVRLAESEQARLEDALRARPSLEQRVIVFGALREMIREGMASLPPVELNTLLRNAGVRVYCKRNRIVEIRLE